jgi:hypothetical protein
MVQTPQSQIVLDSICISVREMLRLEVAYLV